MKGAEVNRFFLVLALLMLFAVLVRGGERGGGGGAQGGAVAGGAAGAAAGMEPGEAAQMEGDEEAGDGAGPGGGASDIGPACDPSASRQVVTFVHVADLHAHYGPDRAGVSRYSRIRAYYESVRGENPYTVFTDGGDDYEKGSVAEQLSKGASTREAVFAMGFDVRVIGNHDFAWGGKELLAFSNDPHAIVLASNIEVTGGDVRAFGAVEYAELQVGCVRVGFLGMVSRPWNALNRKYTGNFLPGFSAGWDWKAIVKRIVDDHRADVDLVVMVSHLGLRTDKDLAGDVDGIDIVLGAHSHEATPEPVVINDTLIVHPGAFGKKAARLDVAWDLSARGIDGCELELASTKSMSGFDPGVQDAVDAVFATYGPEAYRQIAVLENGCDRRCVARLTGSAAIHTTGADAALLDPRRVRRAWGGGGLTQQALVETYTVERQKPGTPGMSALYVVEVSGADLAAMKKAMPSWVYAGPASPSDEETCEVVLHKAPALHPDAFFGPVSYASVRFGSEAWRALDLYGRSRTAACLHIDTDNVLHRCKADTAPAP
ncbi:MAG: metallophosphoesterase [Pseudomonadota bacterium]